MYDGARQAAIADAMGYAGMSPEEVQKTLGTQKRQLLNAITFDALKYAFERRASIEEFNSMLWRATDIVSGIERSVLTADGSHGWEVRNFWRHLPRPLEVIRGNKLPTIDNEQISAVVTDYLRLPFRSVEIERLLVDMLIAGEMFAFGEEMIVPLPAGLRWFPSRSPVLQNHVLIRFFLAHVLNGVVLCGLAYCVSRWLPIVIGYNAATYLAIGLVGWFLLSLAFGIVMLPFAWRQQVRARRHVRDVLSAMAETYVELNSTGTLSTRRIWEVASKASAAGVAWPGPLFALLDDNMRRTGIL